MINMAKTVANTAVNNQLQNTTHASSVARQATFSDFYSIEEMLGKYVQFCCYYISSLQLVRITYTPQVCARGADQMIREFIGEKLIRPLFHRIDVRGPLICNIHSSYSYSLFIDTCPRSMQSRVYVTVRCPSVCLPQHGPTYTAAAGLLLWARPAGAAGECGECHVVSVCSS